MKSDRAIHQKLLSRFEPKVDQNTSEPLKYSIPSSSHATFASNLTSFAILYRQLYAKGQTSDFVSKHQFMVS